MTCHEVQISLSLYLYGELEFAQEEAIEEHLDACAFCQAALTREKSWHSTLNSEQTDVPLELLSRCRQDLRKRLSIDGHAKPQARWAAFMRSWGVSSLPWSGRIAVASFLVFVGFGAGRLLDRTGLAGEAAQGSLTQSSFLDPATTRIRGIQPSGDRVRVLVEQVRQREVVGALDDATVRQLVLAASKDPNDPGLRVDSVEALKDQSGADIREALLYAVQNDSNAGVRLKALEGLQQFAKDPETQQSLTYVLEHDDNPGVRSQAIDLLVSERQRVDFSPELIETLQQTMQSRQNDDYVRMRCRQALVAMKVSADVY